MHKTPSRLRRCLQVSALLMSTALIASACGGSEANTTQKSSLDAKAGPVKFRDAVPGSGDGVKIGYISLSDAVPFIKLVSDSVKKEAKAAGAELVFCDSQGDAAKALDCAKNMKTQGVQGILNFQGDAKAAAAICAAGPDVPVIAIDIEQQPCQKAFMGANNKLAGKIAGKALGEFAKTKYACQYDAYISMEQPEAGAVNEDRMGGFRDGFSEACGDVKNVRKINAFRIDTAQTAFADVLTTLPGKHKILVVGINDDSIKGVVAAAKTAGRANDIWVSAQGADPSSWCEISKNPNWVADAAYFPERYGQIGVPYLLDLIAGKSVPNELFVSHKAITADNISDTYDVSSC